MRLDAGDTDTMLETEQGTLDGVTKLLSEMWERADRDSVSEVTVQDAVELSGRLGGLFDAATRLVAEKMWHEIMTEEMAEKGEHATVEAALERLNKVITRRTIVSDRVPQLSSLHAYTTFAAYQSAVIAHLCNILNGCNEALVIFEQMTPVALKHGIDVEKLRGGDPESMTAFRRATAIEAGFSFDSLGRVIGMSQFQALALGLTRAPETSNDNEPDVPEDVNAALGG